MKWGTVFLAAVALLGCVCDAQYDSWEKPKPRPADPIFRKPAKDAKVPPGTQQKNTFSAPMDWEFPRDPPPQPTPPPPMIDVNPPPLADPVSATCGENMVHVEVKRDLFGIGQFIQAADLTMGGCTGMELGPLMLTFESDMTSCGCMMRVDGDMMIFRFTLIYEPSPLAGSQIIRTSAADFTVECHYPRKHIVSTEPLVPLWVPYSATKVAEEMLYFSLKLMTDDWMYQRPVNHYYLGSMINLEATVFQYHHTPLQVYVDSCVASLGPEVTPDCVRYDFMQNFGCLVDARLTGSRSHFFPRSASNKLQFQLEAFMFQNQHSGGGGIGMGGMATGGKAVGGKTVGDDGMRIYITCNLKAATERHPVDSCHKACSFYDNRWIEASGSDVRDACSCCDSMCDHAHHSGVGPPPADAKNYGSASDPKKRYGRSVKTAPASEWSANQWNATLSISFTVGEKENVGVAV